MNSSLSTLPAAALAALAVLVLVAITLDLIALRDLYHRPAAEVVFANKWIWVAIILLADGGVGAIIYLAAGRRRAALSDDAAPSRPASVRPDTIADTLYGPRDDLYGPRDDVDPR